MARERSSNPRKKKKKQKKQVYRRILVRLFQSHRTGSEQSFEFEREELAEIASELRFKRPKNLGDIIYSYRFRMKPPAEIENTAPQGQEWAIRLAGPGRYRMLLRPIVRLVPRVGLRVIKIPDSTPEIIAANALTDEQALLAKIRYNRLIDIFLRVAAYSLQSHLRTSVKDLGQTETDELYIGVNNSGQQFIIPVQAKRGKDRLGVVQSEQDLAMCREKEKFQRLSPRAVSVQFLNNQEGDVIVMFELKEEGDMIQIVDEKHYRLVPASEFDINEPRRAATE